MKKLLCICMCLVAIAAMAFAGQSEAAKHSTEYLTNYVIAQKAAGTLDFNDPLYMELLTRDRARVAERGAPNLDQGGAACGSALVIASLPYTDSGNLATETDDCVSRPYFDVFYTYTATAAGPHTFDMCSANSAGDTYIRVWTGGTCCSGTNSTGDDNCAAAGLDGTVTVTLAVSQVVYIECGYYYTTGSGTYTFNAAGPPPPTGRCCYGDPCAPTCVTGVTQADCNTLGGTYVAGGSCPCPLPLAGDFCCNALPLTVPGVVSGTTVGFTNNGDGTCGGSGAPDVIYYYTPSVNQNVTFTTCSANTSYDTKLWITEGCSPTAPIIACNDDASSACSFSSLHSLLSCVTLYAGHTYYIYVDGFSTASGNYELTSSICCDASSSFDLTQPVPQYDCITLCAGAVATISVSGGTDWQEPVLTATAGCDALNGSNCSQDCAAATSWATSGWVFDRGTGLWTNTITGDGCVCLCLEGVLDVELNSFSCVAGAGQVQLFWSTATENDNDRFEIVRNGSLVGSVASLGNSTSEHNYNWTDRNVVNGRAYSYTLVAVSVNGARNELATESATPNVTGTVPTEYALAQNFPNPFNPTTEIAFNLAAAGNVSLKVYNLVGQVVATLAKGQMEAGVHTVTFDAANLTSGIYLYRLEANGFAAEKKMVLMK